MQAKNKKIKIFFIVVFVCYIVVLFMFVVLKVNYEALCITKECIKMNRRSGFWNYNMIPFKTLKTYFNSNSSLGIENIVGNIVPFIPMGFILGFILNKHKFRNIFLISLIIVTIFESIQFIACVGYFDIDDIILNVISSMVGYLIYLCFTRKVNSIVKELKAQ